MRKILSLFLISIVLIVSQPYATIGWWVRDVHSVLYWDAADQDEDLFISADSDEMESDFLYQEEAKRDGEEKSKLKLKFKFTPIPEAYCQINPAWYIDDPIIIPQNLPVYLLKDTPDRPPQA